MRGITRRQFGGGSLFGLTALSALSANTSYAASPPVAAPGIASTHMSPAVKAAWQAYFEKLNQLEQFLYSYRFANLPDVQLAANEFFSQVQSFAYNWVMVPRQNYPRFYRHALCEPDVYSLGLFNPDFRYRRALVSGERTYRLWGKRGTSRFFDIQSAIDEDGEPNEEIRSRRPPPKNYQLEKFEIAQDGSFEIIASSKPHKGNWIELPAGAGRVMLNVREALYDWEKEVPVELHIEVIDGKPLGPMLLDEAEFIKRLDTMGKFMHWVADGWGMRIVNLVFESVGEKLNKFGWQNLPTSSGTNPSAYYADCLYDLKPDEALLITFDEPKALYWGVQLGDAYLRTTDYVYHQSSLNPRQAHTGADGKLRMVLSKKDPGVPNWLDPVDNLFGFIQFRQYFSEKAVGLPVTEKINVKDVRRHLPSDTPRISADERAAALRSRRIAMLHLYGY